MAKFELWYPVKKSIKVHQKFGENLIPMYKEMGMLGHNGWDIQAKDGDPIFAAHDGIVTFTGEDGSGGLGVVIRTTQKFDYTKEGETKQVYFKSIYWHLAKGSFKVKPGDSVKAGDLIALADNTGKSTGSHLHFGIKPVIQGEADWQWFNLEQDNGFLGSVDPELHFNSYYAEDAIVVLGIYQKIIEIYKLILNMVWINKD